MTAPIPASAWSPAALCAAVAAAEPDPFPADLAPRTWRDGPPPSPPDWRIPDWSLWPPRPHTVAGRGFRDAVIRFASGDDPEVEACDLCGSRVTAANLSGCDEDGRLTCTRHGPLLGGEGWPDLDAGGFRSVGELAREVAWRAAERWRRDHPDD